MEDKIKLYKYRFLGIKKAVIIQARNRDQARVYLDELLPSLDAAYMNSKVVGESVIVPLRGVSKKTENKISYIFVGEDKSETGWMREDDYRAALKK